jgi:uncharacterized RDD family membrane protein YckC
MEQKSMTASASNNLDNAMYAGFRVRLKAFAFDYLPVAGYILLLFGAALAVTQVMNAFDRPISWPENPLIGDLIAFLVLVLPVILYFTLQEGSSRRSTWGKRKAGLLVVDGRGRKLSYGRAFLRSFLKFLPWQIAHTSLFHWEGWPFAPEEPSLAVLVGIGLAYLLVGIYIASVMISNEHKTPYDLAARSYVIYQNNG